MALLKEDQCCSWARFHQMLLHCCNFIFSIVILCEEFASAELVYLDVVPESVLNNEKAGFSTLQCSPFTCIFFGFCIHCVSPVVFACLPVRCRGGWADPFFPFLSDSNVGQRRVAPAFFRRIAPSSTTTFFSNTMLPRFFSRNFVYCNDSRLSRPNAATTSTKVPWLLSLTRVMSMNLKSITVLFEYKCVCMTR